MSLWVLFNEGWGQFDAREMTEMVRALDPTRQIDHASGWYDQGAGDIKSLHNYFRPLKVKPEERAFAFSEYGGYTYPVQELSTPKNRSATAHTRTRHSTRKRWMHWQKR